MLLLNILEAVLAYDLAEIRFIKEKEVILNGNTNDKSRGIQLIGPGYLLKVIKGVNWLLSPIVPSPLTGKILIHISLASYKRDICKQCRPRSDAAERGVWSGSTLFALSSDISIKHDNNKN